MCEKEPICEPGTSQDADADYDSSHGYDSQGRLARVTGPGLPAYGAVYGFAADLLSQVSTARAIRARAWPVRSAASRARAT